MIIEHAASVTDAVLQAFSRTPSPARERSGLHWYAPHKGFATRYA